MMTIENKDKIAEILYDNLCYTYCDNCRYDKEIPNDDELWSCDNCHRKAMEWGISKEAAIKIADEIEEVFNDE